MSAGGERVARHLLDYFVTKAVLRPDEYGRSPQPAVEALGFGYEDYLRTDGIVVVRCTVMDPFLASGRGRVDFVGGFVKTLRRVMEAQLAAGQA